MELNSSQGAERSESLMEAATLFSLYCTQDRSSISVFECKCALLRGLGVNLTAKEIASRLTSLCGWAANGSGVTQAQFVTFYETIKETHSSGKDTTHYDTYDLRGKGWITEDDVYRVSLRPSFRVLAKYRILPALLLWCMQVFMPVAPKYADKYVHDIFARADVHHVGQVRCSPCQPCRHTCPTLAYPLLFLSSFRCV
jgi:Ca2+-binding EF-hand superfamily protein